MRTSTRILLVALLTAAVLAPSAAYAGKPPVTTTGTIAGTVTADIFGGGVSGATVTAYTYSRKSGWSAKASTTTNASGAYTLALPAGTYALGFSAASLTAEYYDNQATIDKATKLSLVGGATIVADAALASFQDGSVAYPFLVHDVASLRNVSANLAAQYRQVRDIDLAGQYVAPIGTRSAAFRGRYDGAGFAIRNMSIVSTFTQDIGLFGVNYGTIVGLDLVNPTVSAPGAYQVGALVGYNDGFISRCSVTGGSVSGLISVGGLVGENRNRLGAPIVDCYSTAVVNGRYNVGGLAGTMWGSLVNCYAAGAVVADPLYTPEGRDVGGLVGNDSNTIGFSQINSYYDIQASGITTISPYVTPAHKGTPLTTAQMQDPMSFPDWDFGTCWLAPVPGVSYPTLR